MSNGGGYQLQTDKLLQETGATRIACEVLHHHIKDRHRLVILSAVGHELHTPQSVAYTLLAPTGWSSQIHVIDQLLSKGCLMGQTFRQHGYDVRQNRLFRIRLPLISSRIAALYNCSRWRLAEVECYEFWAGNTLYGTVLEIKAPGRKLAPSRRRLGSYSALQCIGIREELFQSWLTQEATIIMKHWPHIACAWVWGLLVSIKFYFRTHRMSLRYLPAQSNN